MGVFKQDGGQLTVRLLNFQFKSELLTPFEPNKMSSPQTLKKCGLRFDPPAIVVTYTVKSSGKLHRRTMPLRNFNKRTGVARTAQELKESSRHEKYLRSIPLPQLEKLIQIIQDKMNGIDLKESLEKNKQMDTLDPEEDLNTVDEETL